MPAQVLDLAARREEVKRIANDLRVLHKVKGGVVLVFLEEHECPFGFAIPDGLQEVILPLLPEKLRAIANLLEQGMPVELVESRVP
jgi:hypothetical protein